MKCFNHHKQDAVGVCKSCLKGVCADCAKDIGGGITCSDECESVAKDNIRLVKNTVDAQKDFKKGGAYFGPLYLFLMGIAFISFGLYKKSFFEFGTIIGSIFCLFGVLLFIINYRHARRS